MDKIKLEIKPENINDKIADFIKYNYTRLYEDQTVGQALEWLRSHKPEGKIVYFYITDRQEKLLGVIPVRLIISGEPDRPLRSIMIDKVITLRPDNTVLEASELFLEHRLLALPVVDKDNRLIGVIDITMFTDEIDAYVRQKEVNNAFQLIGVHVALGKKITPMASFFDRFPWLVCNIVSGMICAFIASRHELLISELTILAVFITVVLALAESISMQSMTVTVQTFGHHTFSLGQVMLALRKELSASLLLALGSGLIVGGVAYIWRSNWQHSFTIGSAIFLAMITACVIGVLIPSIVRGLKIDPRISSGPVVLAITDVLTLTYYFGLAEWSLGA